MPKKPLRPCRSPGCPALVEGGGYCDMHKGEATRYNREQRPKSHQYYGTARWKKLRAMQLQREPLCRECRKQGKIVSATVADHIIEREKGGADSLTNLQSLCANCHGRKHAGG